jgi:hypothetical protein
MAVDTNKSLGCTYMLQLLDLWLWMAREAGLGGGVSEDGQPEMGLEEEYLLEQEGSIGGTRLLGSWDLGFAMGVPFWGL